MKKSVFSLAFIATLLLVSANSQAQSLKRFIQQRKCRKSSQRRYRQEYC